MVRPVARACLGLLLAVLLLSGCGAPVAPPPSSSSSSSAAASPSAVALPAGLPVPVGHRTGCAARSLRLGPARVARGAGSLHSAVRRLELRVRNLGPRCVLREPSVVYVARRRGPYHPVRVQGLDARRAMPLPRQAVRWLRLTAWWAVPRRWLPCHRPVAGVDRMAFRTGPGYLRFALRFTARRVCTSPASLSFYVQMHPF